MNIQQIKRLAMLFAASLLTTTSAQGVVNLKNGNFYVAYDDLSVDGETGLQLSRHYNSRSGARGWFGAGWGTEFETRLFVMPDGLVAVRENGNAHVTFYGQSDPGAVDKAIDQIVQTLRQQGLLKPQQEAGLRQQLRDDPLLRLQWAERYQLTGTAPAVGTRLNGAEYESAMDRFAEISDSDLLLHAMATGDRNATLLRLKQAYIVAREDACGQLVRTQAGFERGSCSDRRFADQQRFDLQGRLTQLNIKGNWLHLGYGRTRNPERITDQSGKSIDMKWNDQGFISQISGFADGKNRVTDYSYDPHGNLIKSDAHTANVYRYQYDGRHNMTAILYSDDKKKSLEYDDRGRVTHITQRDGEHAIFHYQTNAQGDTDTVYLAQFGGPAHEIRRLRYDSKGKLLMDRDARSIQEYEYHPTQGVVTRYRSNDLDCRYEYNAQAKVTHESCPATATNNYLDYDAAGNITKATLSIPLKQQERLGSRHVVMLMQYDQKNRVTRMGEMGEPGHVTQRYANDADTQGEIEFQQFPEHDIRARLRFGEKVSLVSRSTKDIERRTRINSGFVMVQE